MSCPLLWSTFFSIGSAICCATRISSGTTSFQNVFSNDLCVVVRCSDCLLFACDMKMFRKITSPQGSFLLQSNKTCVRGRLISNSMKLGNSSRVIAFSRKIILVGYDYKLCNSSTAYMWGLWVPTDSRLHFHHKVNHIFYQMIVLWVCTRAHSCFSSFDFVVFIFFRLYNRPLLC